MTIQKFYATDCDDNDFTLLYAFNTRLCRDRFVNGAASRFTLSQLQAKHGLILQEAMHTGDIVGVNCYDGRYNRPNACKHRARQAIVVQATINCEIQSQMLPEGACNTPIAL